MNPLNSISAAIISGVVLAMIVFVISPGSGFNELSLTRWLHILSGIMWVGLLFYVNVAQIPGHHQVRGAARAAVVPLGGCRDVPDGRRYLGPSANFAGAFMLGMGGESVNLYQLVIGIGAWLGTIMLFNVWVLIWPSQKKVLGLVPATDEQKAAARKTTLYATRANFILSVPLLLCMGSAGHGLPF